MGKHTTTPLKASSLKEVYKGERDLKSIAIQKSCIRLSGDGYFYTLQGEGPTIGLPAVFVRLHHCNLQCSWCDAFYTWDKRSKEFWTESWPTSFEELANQLEDLWLKETGDDVGERRIIWTGGEPLMQKNQIDEVMCYLWSGVTNNPFWHPEIETNGTILPTKLQLENFQFNVSPKLANSGNPISKTIKPKVLATLNEVNSTFKFVCKDEKDVREIIDTFADFIDWDKIIIMPEGVVEEEITKHARILAPVCKQYSLRMLPRFQAIAFDGAARGV